MLNDIVSLTKKLIEFPSIASNIEAKVAIWKFVEEELPGKKFIPFASNGIPSLLFTNQKKENTQFKIVLNAHLDVVAGKEGQYEPFEKDGKLFGRGAYDMKASAAVMILVFKELADKIPYPLALQLVTDEEIGGENGTKYQIEKGIQSEFVLGGEHSLFKINNESKGITLLKVKTLGISAHSAYPWNGDNAAVKMFHGIQKLHEVFPIPTKELWATTATVVKVETDNPAVNTVPDNCISTINIRSIPEDKRDILKAVQEVFPKDTEITVEFHAPPEFTAENDPFVLQLKKCVADITKQPVDFLKTHGQSDLRYYHMQGIPGVNLGPVGGGHHNHEEWVDIKSLEQYYHILKNFLLSVK